MSNDRNHTCLVLKQWHSHNKQNYGIDVKRAIEGSVKITANRTPIITSHNEDGSYTVKQLTGSVLDLGFTAASLDYNNGSRAYEDGKQNIFSMSVQAGNYIGANASFDATSAYAGSATTQVYADLGLHATAKAGMSLEDNGKVNDFKTSDYLTTVASGVSVGTGVRDLKSGINFKMRAGAEYNYNRQTTHERDYSTEWQGVVLDVGASVEGTHPFSNSASITWSIEAGAKSPLYNNKSDWKTIGQDLGRNFQTYVGVSLGLVL